MISRGISAAGGFLPKARLARSEVSQIHGWALPGLKGKAKGTKTVAAWDQDSITMAVEAFRNSGAATRNINQLTLASTSHPFRDRSSSAIALAALALPDTTLTADTSCNRRAGTSALLQALLNQAAGATAVLCAEKRTARPGSWAEILWGDGGAAVVVDNENPIATLVGWHSNSDDCIDFYTADGFAPYPGEDRWVKDEVVTPSVVASGKKALAAAGVGGADIHWAVLPAPLSASEKSLAKGLGLSNAQLITETIMASAGDLGSALPLYGLAVALESAQSGDRILVSSFGNGCDTLIFKVNSPLPTAGSEGSASAQLGESVPVKYGAYATSRGLIDLDFGPRGERIDKTFLSVHERDRKNITGFFGGKTSADAPSQFPKSPMALDGTLMAGKDYIDVRLADETARVVAFTIDNLTFTPEPPFQYGLVEFESGARVLMELVDIPASGIAVGDKVAMKFRIKSLDRERGYRHYFWKAAPLSKAEAQ